MFSVNKASECYVRLWFDLRKYFHFSQDSYGIPQIFRVSYKHSPCKKSSKWPSFWPLIILQKIVNNIRAFRYPMTLQEVALKLRFKVHKIKTKRKMFQNRNQIRKPQYPFKKFLKIQVYELLIFSPEVLWKNIKNPFNVPLKGIQKPKFEYIS